MAFLGRIGAASASMLLLWPLRGQGESPLGLAVLIALGALVFVIGVRVFRVFGPDERDLMHRASPRAWHLLEPIVAGRNPGGSS